jgi:hypothetical protein
LTKKYLNNENKQSMDIDNKKKTINRIQKKNFFITKKLNSNEKVKNKNKNNQPLSEDKKKSIEHDENNLTLKSHKLLNKFLSEINMTKYMNIFALNGFDDINLILEQSKNGNTSIQDSELKEAGIKMPGDRAKILIRIQELSNNFLFKIPKEVYYNIDNKTNIENDHSIKKLKEWLKTLKMEQFLMNFINCGYYSIELMLMQMASNNPITSEILKEDIGIEKVGHRSRIINKLKSDSRSYISELTINLLVMNIGEEKTDNCQCIIF